MNEVSDNLSFYRLKGVSRRREKGGIIFELEIPELIIRHGDFIAVTGPSGCGKSTLLDILGLILQPDCNQTFTLRRSGDPNVWDDIATLGEARLADLRKAKIGYVLQNGGLLPFLTVRENIELPARLNRLKNTRGRAAELAGKLGITEQLDKKPAQLSGGQRQRAAIARGLVHGPAIVLADEPTAAVDQINAVDIRNQFSDLARQQQVAVLMVTHDKKLVLPVINRLLTFTTEKRGTNHTVSRLQEVPANEWQ
ncbi:ATP-binding cassette domain-containing protein [Desulforhopalus vacuolatus]|uniref:ABC transporter ATP-binding protein n=1 Tax=Desulforhopalus vacuolatus TaxID=40414 RepID=UPI001962AC3B|nr:ATP-binding cassette domain-containing protein [Desulforhopalus vacuolatus]MBM9519417.1 ATP-binding cassette domain-containing protein [Desulforhopalus vacuolatus]